MQVKVKVNKIKTKTKQFKNDPQCVMSNLSLEQKFKVLRDAIANPFSSPPSDCEEFFNEIIDLEDFKRRQMKRVEMKEVKIKEVEVKEEVENVDEVEEVLIEHEEEFKQPTHNDTNRSPSPPSTSPTPSSTSTSTTSIPVKTPSGRTLRSNAVNTDEPRRLRSNK